MTVTFDPGNRTLSVSSRRVTAQYWGIYSFIRLLIEGDEKILAMIDKNGITPKKMAVTMDSPDYERWTDVAGLLYIEYGDGVVQSITNRGYTRTVALWALQGLKFGGNTKEMDDFRAGCGPWLNNIIQEAMKKSATMREASMRCRGIIPQKVAERYVERTVMPWIRRRSGA